MRGGNYSVKISCDGYITVDIIANIMLFSSIIIPIL